MTTRCGRDRGFALAEVVMATAIIAIGLLAAAAALHYATDTLELSRRDTVAVFLAEQRLERLKARAMVNWNDADLVAGVYVEACDPIAMTCRVDGTAATTTRTTTIVDAAETACGPKCKVVRVTVTLRAGAERRLDVGTILTSRT
jgi:prepilin-type N-terminal cleavage/methylation domain-containing protein